MTPRQRTTAAVALAVALAACGTTEGGTAGSDPTADAGPAAPSCTATVVPVGARIDLAAGRGPAATGLADSLRDVEILDLGGLDATGMATALAAELDPCDEAEPVTAAGGIGALVVAAAAASAEGRPLVLTAGPAASGGAGSAAATVTAALELLDRWGATELLLVGEDDVAAWTALVVAASTDAVVLPVPAPPVPVGPAEPDAPTAPIEPAAPAEPAGSVEPTAPVEPTPPAPRPADPVGDALALLPAGVTVTAVASDTARADALAARLAAAGRPADAVRTPTADAAPQADGVLWLVDPGDAARAVVAAAAAGARDQVVITLDPVDASDVLRHATGIRAARPTRVLLVGGAGAGPTTTWALDAALHTDPLPWGGHLPLEGTRIVALYGTPGGASLGALGQQDLEATIVRVRETAARYDLDGFRIVPGFDVIATVASASPGPVGDYSQRVPIERLRPLIDRAGEEGMAVFIDLQPGRTDFLTQAKEYEELLLEPHVFLALDPEWRLRPDQVHLRQIGSVEAAEVQLVADWLAELVRRERLPQKAFMLHQFLLEMLPDRDTVVVPPELVGVVHVDGQGAVATKERTFRIMAEGADPQWRWGWKQFLRIDTPAIMDPADVIDRFPLPVVITYQ